MCPSLERRYYSVFKDESKLDINYVPIHLPHRLPQLDLLNQFFRFAIERPGKMTQRVLITGNVGTGKTVISQRFGQSIEREARDRRINLHHIHVNCREIKGSLFMILQRIILKFHPSFPRRGYSAEEVLETLMQVLDEQNAYVILVMDELEALIRLAGSDPIYNLTRVQENRVQAPQRISLICILRETECLRLLDPSTRSTLQRNIVHLDEYSPLQLHDILSDRVNLAFRSGAISDENINFVVESTSSERGDARCAIELLWRSGKYADTSESTEILPEHVRKAAVSIYPSVRKDIIDSLSFHEKMFLLSIARSFKRTAKAYLSMGEAEESYTIVCEEWGEKARGHTQIWKYLKELYALGVINTEISGAGIRGKTTLISLPKIPASDLERVLTENLRHKRR